MATLSLLACCFRSDRVKAGIIVQPANPRRETKAKYASAHDLRRSCAERLREAGVPWEHVQKSAAVLRELLAPKPERATEGTDSQPEGAKAYLGTADGPN